MTLTWNELKHLPLSSRVYYRIDGLTGTILSAPPISTAASKMILWDDGSMTFIDSGNRNLNDSSMYELIADGRKP
jgi:hypothetical protein